MTNKKQKLVFVLMWTFIGWRDLSLGFHLCLGELYVDIHLPFGWIRVGWERVPRSLVINAPTPWYRQYGLIRYRFAKRIIERAAMEKEQTITTEE